MYIYLAARYGRRLELCGYRAALQERGHIVTGRWLNGLHEFLDKEMPIEQAAQWAQEDMADVAMAQCLIAFTEARDSGYSRGGRHVELGLALAMRKHIMIVGPRENVFCMLPGIAQYDTFDVCLQAIQEKA